ncbi:MAG: hypothetical protein ABSA53_07450 [Streptosporangiaceae bacterium]|jgi:hypothetical protein
MALALNLGHPDKPGRGYAEVTQARPGFLVLAVVSAAVAIALASREHGEQHKEGGPGADR